jgi:hypothetical protein
MSIDDATTPGQMEDWLRKRIDTLTHARDIYAIGSYGWLDAYTEDSELIGHAMWQVSPPFGIDVSIHESALRPGQTELDPWQAALAISGVEFDGMMDAARLSLGLALFHADRVKDVLVGGRDFYELHYMSAMIALGMASERIRAFFIAGVHRKTEDEYERGKHDGKHRKHYTTPFIEALAAMTGGSEMLAEALQGLPVLAEGAQEFTKARNAIVHDLATELGRLEKRRIKNELPSEWPKDAIDFDAMRRAGQEAEQRHRQQIDDALDGPVSWYKLLVELSNKVFMAEYETRRALGI